MLSYPDRARRKNARLTEDPGVPIPGWYLTAHAKGPRRVGATQYARPCERGRPAFHQNGALPGSNVSNRALASPCPGLAVGSPLFRLHHAGARFAYALCFLPHVISPSARPSSHLINPFVLSR